jgi:hypothetical protein
MSARISKDDQRRLRNAQRRTSRARRNPITFTCPASRHLHLMADALASGQTYHMFTEEPGHCAETMYSVLESLWKARAR